MDVYHGDQNPALHKSEDIFETPNVVLVTKLQVRFEVRGSVCVTPHILIK